MYASDRKKILTFPDKFPVSLGAKYDLFAHESKVQRIYLVKHVFNSKTLELILDNLAIIVCLPRVIVLELRGSILDVNISQKLTLRFIVNGGSEFTRHQPQKFKRLKSFRSIEFVHPIVTINW